MYPPAALRGFGGQRPRKNDVEEFLTRVEKIRKNRKTHVPEDLFSYEEKKRLQNSEYSSPLDGSDRDDDALSSGATSTADRFEVDSPTGGGDEERDNAQKAASHAGSANSSRRDPPQDTAAQRETDQLRENMSEELHSECVECFMFHDGNKDGLVPLEELPWMLRNLGQLWTKKELNALITQLQIDGVTELDLTKFIDIVATEQGRRKLDARKLADAFRVMDRQKKNSVVLSELKHYMQTFGDRMSEEDWNMLVGTKGDVFEGYYPSAIKQATFIEMFAGSPEKIFESRSIDTMHPLQ
ncbi:UNVERIFIED_CONTAM: EF hand domain-containing protein [Hammondia hammondi]|eukprot:XP_008882521.1 EF hand domain-containing protein [Hammondia hammondi]